MIVLLVDLSGCQELFPGKHNNKNFLKIKKTIWGPFWALYAQIKANINSPGKKTASF